MRITYPEDTYCVQVLCSNTSKDNCRITAAFHLTSMDPSRQCGSRFEKSLVKKL